VLLPNIGLPLKFTKFMDWRELREAVLREHSGGGTPYEVEVWYFGAGEQYFKGGWSQFAEDHDLLIRLKRIYNF
jgi:hypothetical protein